MKETKAWVLLHRNRAFVSGLCSLRRKSLIENAESFFRVAWKEMSKEWGYKAIRVVLTPTAKPSKKSKRRKA